MSAKHETQRLRAAGKVAFTVTAVECLKGDRIAKAILIAVLAGELFLLGE
jgi:hypothetical protein